MRGLRLRKEKRMCIVWYDRETELERMCSRFRQYKDWDGNELIFKLESVLRR